MCRNFKFYLTLFSLVFVLNGCYTLLSDPLKISPKPKVDIHNIKEQGKNNESYPMVNRHYVRRSYQPYVYWNEYYNYRRDPHYYNSYHSFDHHHVHDVPQTSVSQTLPQQVIKVEVKNTPSSRDVEKAQQVWEKRISPRSRKAPTPTRR
tara:strand:+ start:135 stop:581 length:447 start_codon:yes stop_codon:yes gene_type:complete